MKRIRRMTALWALCLCSCTSITIVTREPSIGSSAGVSVSSGQNSSVVESSSEQSSSLGAISSEEVSSFESGVSSGQDSSFGEASSEEVSSSSSVFDDRNPYYASIDFTLGGKALKTALSELINSNCTSLSYSGLWTAFKDTDTRDGTIIWDMYSNESYVYGSNQCGNYNGEGSCYNREHSIPKSWFNSAAPAYTDLFHLYPTDGYVNGRRSNYPFGEVGTATYTSKNGSKLGKSSFSGYSDIVFEPIDEYKGDFARTYFYFATRYENLNCALSEGAAVFTTTSYPKLTNYALQLFLKWDRQDPISEKEILRNEAVYLYQNNRNPFIDFPGLAEMVWNS